MNVPSLRVKMRLGGSVARRAGRLGGAAEAHKTPGLLQQLVAKVQDGLRRAERAQPQQGHEPAAPPRGERFCVGRIRDK